jgi:hypothetical protein
MEDLDPAWELVPGTDCALCGHPMEELRADTTATGDSLSMVLPPPRCTNVHCPGHLPAGDLPG